MCKRWGLVTLGLGCFLLNRMALLVADVKQARGTCPCQTSVCGRENPEELMGKAAILGLWKILANSCGALQVSVNVSELLSCLTTGLLQAWDGLYACLSVVRIPGEQVWGGA